MRKNNIKLLYLYTAITLVSVGLSSRTTAQQIEPKSPLIFWKSSAVTVQDVEADGLRLPSDERNATIKNPRTLVQILDNIHIYRELADRAKRENKITPEILHSTTIAVERQIGTLYLQSELEQYKKNLGDLTSAAREQYTLNQKKYDRPEQINTSHILISSKTRPSTEAKKIAQDLREKITEGANFEELAKKYSDDKGSVENGGLLGTFARGAMIKPFEDAAFNMQKKGELSPVVETTFGYHIIRLNGREQARKSTFDEVKAEIIDELTEKAVAQRRELMLGEIRGDPTLKINERNFEQFTGAKPTRKPPELQNK
jgi:peptidyl-prolyl cis-trans isomerase C